MQKFLKSNDMPQHVEAKLMSERWQQLLQWKKDDLNKLNKLKSYRNDPAHPDICDISNIQSALEELKDSRNLPDDEVDDFKRFFNIYQKLKSEQDYNN
jgi:hypothetical protein